MKLEKQKLFFISLSLLVCIRVHKLTEVAEVENETNIIFREVSLFILFSGKCAYLNEPRHDVLPRRFFFFLWTFVYNKAVKEEKNWKGLFSFLCLLSLFFHPSWVFFLQLNFLILKSFIKICLKFFFAFKFSITL